MGDFWKVYVLFQGDTPVYVGCTSKLSIRINDHRRDKVFDSYRVIYQNVNKEKAQHFEFACITFLKGTNQNIYNKQKVWFANQKVVIIPKKHKN